ncbi:MAG: HDIG domain-containing protein [Spirochaetaceae bacterium]|nr:HDIG domain-containing protein [Spirochaetaceae bacterium]MBQ3024725.1 HDIG domain-containing protein [Spirochaetaceae bacterium]
MKKQKTFSSNSTNLHEKNYFLNPFNFINKNKGAFFVILATFISLLVITFFDVATRETVASFALSEYQIGQIADRTIIAEKSLPATEYDPIQVNKDEKIIRKGFPITDENYAKLRKIAEAPSYIDFRALANAFLYLFLLVVLTVFLFSPYMLGREIKLKEMIFIAVLYVIVYAVTTFATKVPAFLSQFSLTTIIPSTFAAMLITVLFSQSSAVFFSILMALGVLFISSFQPVPCLFVLCSSIASAKIVSKTEKRIDMVFASVILAILNIIFLFALSIIVNDDAEFGGFVLFGVALNAFVSGIFALGFLTPLESILNTASVFRLMDLSDLNNPMMRRMLITAPGTYNHSMMVATLAETACNEIGANALLARVGSYYHDIGKLEQPEYFVENQTEGNKHDDINPSLSVSVIKSHVKKGVEKANQLRLPQEVTDIIAEHHGNGLIYYFYHKAKQQEDNNIDPEYYTYTYNGDSPSSKEAAVVMLADTVEAACRTLVKPSVPRLEKFIRQLIMDKVENHLLDKCQLRFCDLDVIQDSFVKILAGYYHSRIEYPNQKNSELDEVDSEQEKDSKKD